MAKLKENDPLPMPVQPVERLRREDMTVEQIQVKEQDRITRQLALVTSHIDKITLRAATATDPVEKARLENLLAYHTNKKIEVSALDAAVLAEESHAKVAIRRTERETMLNSLRN